MFFGGVCVLLGEITVESPRLHGDEYSKFCLIDVEMRKTFLLMQNTNHVNAFTTITTPPL